MALRIGFTGIVLAGTSLCAWFGSAYDFWALLLAAGWTALAVAGSWPLINILGHGASAGSYAELCLTSISSDGSIPDPPPDSPRASRLADASRAIADRLSAAQRRLADTESEIEQMKVELDQSVREAAAAREEAGRYGEQVSGQDARIESMMGAVSDAAMGDLTKRVNVSGEDALASFGLSVNEMISGLAMLVDQLRQAAGQVTTSTTEIQSAAAQQATGASEQAASITQVTSTGEELAASAKQIAEHSESVIGAAERAQQTVRTAEGAIQSASQGMEKIREASERSGKTIGGLNERAQKIGNIISIIVDIADQTKLLSLNAAIEAARAGEAGKGFAVVATEIRNLANSVTESTRDIQELLVEIQESAGDCATAAEEDTRRVSEGTTLVTSIAEALAQIETTIDDTMQVARQIGVSTRQQQSASEQMAAAMKEIAQVAQQSADASQQMGVAASGLLELANSLQGTVGSIRTSAN